LWQTTKSTTTKNAGKSSAFLIAMRIQQYDAGPIAQWSTSRRSRWMMPFGKCLCRIAPVAVMVDNFGGKLKTLTKSIFI
jgi:hypothetical protein